MSMSKTELEIMTEFNMEIKSIKQLSPERENELIQNLLEGKNVYSSKEELLLAYLPYIKKHCEIYYNEYHQDNIVLSKDDMLSVGVMGFYTALDNVALYDGENTFATWVTIYLDAAINEETKYLSSDKLDPIEATDDEGSNKPYIKSIKETDIELSSNSAENEAFDDDDFEKVYDDILKLIASELSITDFSMDDLSGYIDMLYYYQGPTLGDGVDDDSIVVVKKLLRDGVKDYVSNKDSIISSVSEIVELLEDWKDGNYKTDDVSILDSFSLKDDPDIATRNYVVSKIAKILTSEKTSYSTTIQYLILSNVFRYLERTEYTSNQEAFRQKIFEDSIEKGLGYTEVEATLEQYKLGHLSTRNVREAVYCWCFYVNELSTLKYDEKSFKNLFAKAKELIEESNVTSIGDREIQYREFLEIEKSLFDAQEMDSEINANRQITNEYTDLYANVLKNTSEDILKVQSIDEANKLFFISTDYFKQKIGAVTYFSKQQVTTRGYILKYLNYYINSHAQEWFALLKRFHMGEPLVPRYKFYRPSSITQRLGDIRQKLEAELEEEKVVPDSTLIRKLPDLLIFKKHTGSDGLSPTDICRLPIGSKEIESLSLSDFEDCNLKLPEIVDYLFAPKYSKLDGNSDSYKKFIKNLILGNRDLNRQDLVLFLLFVLDAMHNVPNFIKTSVPVDDRLDLKRVDRILDKSHFSVLNPSDCFDLLALLALDGSVDFNYVIRPLLRPNVLNITTNSLTDATLKSQRAAK